MADAVAALATVAGPWLALDRQIGAALGGAGGAKVIQNRIVVSAAVGVHGLTAFSVAQRSHEIALRMALGATRNRVVALVVSEGLALACIGSAVGVIGAHFVGRAMQNILFGVPATDFLTLIAVGLGLFLPALVACYYPALRAATVEIMQALKAE